MNDESGKKNNSVLLLQDLALEQWKSMDYYADELKRWLPVVEPNLQFIAPSEYRSFAANKNGTITTTQRFYFRYLAYPAALRRYEAELVHILDHSYAHLLRGRDPSRAIITVHDLYPFYPTSQGRLRSLVRAQS